MTNKQKETLLLNLGFKQTEHGEIYWSRIVKSKFLSKIKINISGKYIWCYTCFTNRNIEQYLIIKRRFTKMNILRIINFLNND